MSVSTKAVMMAVALSLSTVALPALASPDKNHDHGHRHDHGRKHEHGRKHGHGHGHKHKHGHGHDDKHLGHYVSRNYRHCPPGLARKTPACVPPGHARKADIRYGRKVGDRLRANDYVLVRDYRPYDLKRDANWNYYRDDNRIFRVDNDTQQILAIFDLARALLR